MLVELLTLLLVPISLLLRRRRLSETDLKDFYRSWAWKRLRYEAIKRYGRQCQCCGTGGRIVVDHIRPVRTHPHLRLKLSNLQILCNDCNMGEGEPLLPRLAAGTPLNEALCPFEGEAKEGEFQSLTILHFCNNMNGWHGS
jgi:hypothetical protein